MCSSYWNLRDVEFKCPSCGVDTSDCLQTHFMGNVDSSGHYYALGEPVAELGDMTVTLGSPADGHPDDLIGSCEECGTFMDFAARIVSGAVVEVWPYQYGGFGREVPVPR